MRSTRGSTRSSAISTVERGWPLRIRRPPDVHPHVEAEDVLATTPYLTGAELTVADAYLFGMIGWPPYFKVDLRPYPHLTRHHARISERPSFLRMKEIIAPVLGRMKLPDFPDFGVGGSNG